MDYQLLNYGDSSICITFSESFTEEGWRNTHSLSNKIHAEKQPWIQSIIPTYTSLIIQFDVLSVTSHEVKNYVKHALNSIEIANFSGVTYKVPVLYGGFAGPDLEKVTLRTEKTQEEIIELHTKQSSRILCFTSPAGQPLMDDSCLPSNISRLHIPRKRVPKGSIAVVGDQTTIYTRNTPGGWNIIGKTPIKITDPKVMPPTELNIGDRVKFHPINENEWGKYEFLTLNDLKEDGD